MNLNTWSWLFLVIYVGLMVLFGVIGRRRVLHADDFATARGGYGPLFLALAFAATTASGATFLGIPGLAYQAGLPSLWLLIGYPVGTYLGVFICLRLVSRGGDQFGSRSIPEYLGNRYDSEAVRLIAAVFSLLLLTYLAGQLIAAIVMFEQMLGLSAPWALGITLLVLLLYVELGGSHADILTDGFQGAVMLLLAAGLGVLFFIGYGVDGGFPALLDRLRALDANAVTLFNPGHMLFASAWTGIAIVIAHIPLGLLPHLGNKLWALDDPAHRRRFVLLAFGMALVLPAMALGGILARVLLGDVLMDGGANQALPSLFKEIFPAWLAALLGVGILAAVMSTADGLVISCSQVFANDLYRLTIVPRLARAPSGAALDRRVLAISRWATLGTLAVAGALAWNFIGMNVTLAIWVGLGGMMAGLAGPLFLGAVWRRVTRSAAVWGFLAGAGCFGVLHAGLIDPAVVAAGGTLHGLLVWLNAQAPNPYACTALAEAVGLVVTATVSLLTRPLPEAYLARVFG